MDEARPIARALTDKYQKKYPDAVNCLTEGLEDSLTFYAFGDIGHRKRSSSNMIERLNREIRRRTSVVSIFPCKEAYLWLITAYRMDYANDWDKKGKAYIAPAALQEIIR